MIVKGSPDHFVSRLLATETQVKETWDQITCVSLSLTHTHTLTLLGPLAGWMEGLCVAPKESSPSIVHGCHWICASCVFMFLEESWCGIHALECVAVNTWSWGKKLIHIRTLNQENYKKGHTNIQEVHMAVANMWEKYHHVMIKFACDNYLVMCTQNLFHASVCITVKKKFVCLVPLWGFFFKS